MGKYVSKNSKIGIYIFYLRAKKKFLRTKNLGTNFCAQKCPIFFNKIFLDAFLLLSKYDGNPTLSSQATSLKTSPPLISVDDARMKIIVDHINSTGGYPDENFMYNVSLEELRALYFHYTGSIKSNIGQSEYQQSTINLKARQISQLQNLRRLLEDIRERFSVCEFVLVLFYYFISKLFFLNIDFWVNF